MDQQQFQELTHDEKKEYRAQFKPQKEEPKEGEYERIIVENAKSAQVMCKEIADLKSQIATLKAAETFSRGQMIGFSEWITNSEYYLEGDTWFDSRNRTMHYINNLLNDYIKQKQ